MPPTLIALLLFLTAVSVDSLAAGLTYGTGRVHITLPSYLILACVPAAFITVSNRVGSYIFLFLPESVLPILSCILLTLIGISKLSESLIKLIAHRHPSLTRNWGCKIKQIHIIFTVYLSPEDANRDDLQVLSPKEALLLSLALSLDSVLVGMAFTTGPIPPAVLFLSAALFNLLLFVAGHGIGRLVSSAFRVDLSWLSGLILILLALQPLL
ncbi:MAG: manganese efflux pump [Lachnospiraceae bacterium]|nr:manganese efflux pump [Lachnospiraceae bacterium]